MDDRLVSLGGAESGAAEVPIELDELLGWADELRAGARRLVAEARRQGTTTIEIKSGYGLSTADEPEDDLEGSGVAKLFGPGTPIAPGCSGASTAA